MSPLYLMEIRPRRMDSHGNYPVWFISNDWQRVPQKTYNEAAKKWQEWLKTLPLFVGYDTYQYGNGKDNIIYVKDDRDLAIIKLAFDSKLFE